jgi:hypothetical protein
MIRKLTKLQERDLEDMLDNIKVFHTIYFPRQSKEYAFMVLLEYLKKREYDCSVIESKYYKRRALYLQERLGGEKK